MGIPKKIKARNRKLLQKKCYNCGKPVGLYGGRIERARYCEDCMIQFLRGNEEIEIPYKGERSTDDSDM